MLTSRIPHFHYVVGHLAQVRHRIYIMPIHFSWDEKKRLSNLFLHKLDFVDAPVVFKGVTFTFEDARFAYAEQRFVTLGLLAETIVSIVHTETSTNIHVISFRKATRNEARIFFENIQSQNPADS
jgi:uncharacterized protein